MCSPMEAQRARKRQRKGTEESPPTAKRNLSAGPEQSVSKRSRSSANVLAKELLASGRPTTDAMVVSVLRKWKFANNTTRQNVMPVGQAFVHSDTMGLVMSRTGRLVVSRHSREHPAVFTLMASWLASWWPHQRPFPFISVSAGVIIIAHNSKHAVAFVFW